ncbi:MAG: hypothetical protein A2Z11_00820 [Candidatus Woykebacteria bacterium RBG_16_43_9]|uniref:EfeO-type cupredoxin-like domain-containing protein n=1 Tax=Candidatus Woykebacteria bacterium RBG_16_43_9 TaxID=1802596 RepID=A0A1G1WFY0_9BACT|nr:MAG: hypothetical protein A2Z11_00820 [Candidatus Woykebacteria bacterium RBG_16_43_9]
MRNIIIAIIVIVVLGVGFVLFRSFSQEPSVTVTKTPVATSSVTPSATTEEEGSSVTITYTSSGFSPSEVTIKSGGTVTWVNNSDGQIQIGANPHPVHTGNKEVSSGGFVLTLQPGEQSTVTMSKVGTFGYHNHLNSSQGGTITVE